MIGFGYQKAGKLLDSCGLSSAGHFASFTHLLLEPVAERRWAESLAHVAHERDDSGGKGCAITLACGKRIHELFQARAGVTFPERNAPVKKSTEGSGGLVVAAQYQKRRSRS